jgi:hypothetical protein
MSWKLGLTFYSNQVFIINPLEVGSKELKDFMINHNYHIYLLCKRKKLFFVSCDNSDSKFNISTFYYLDDLHEKKQLRVKHSKELFINSHNEGKMNVDFKDQKGIIIQDYNIINSLYHIESDLIGDSVKEKLPSDLEVIYVGQAYGRNKLRQIDKRLTNHEKLQKIALEIIQKGTLEEVLVIGLNYLVKDLATAFVTVDTDRNQFSLENMIKLRNQARKRIPESQEVTVYEASLINYFQPELNVEYRESFPSRGYVSYEEIYKTRFDYSSMEIDTYNTGARIFSKEVPESKYHHDKNYILDSAEEKKEFFDYLFQDE